VTPSSTTAPPLHPRRPARPAAPRRVWALLLPVFVSLLLASPGRGNELAGRPLASVEIEGLEQAPEQLVRNQVRATPGQPYDPQTVRGDIVRITFLGRFSAVRARVEPLESGALALTYVVEEQPLLRDVQVVGNKELGDDQLLALVLLRDGDPVDESLIERGERQIEQAYADEGYFVADVEYDRELLESERILIYRVREGPRVRIEDIRFRGARSIDEDRLRQEIRSRTRLLVFRKGALNRDLLTRDVAAIRDLYRSFGYLDAQVGRRIDLSPEQDRAVVTFVIEEGPQYTVDQIEILGATIFPEEQVRRAMTLRPGSVYSAEAVTASQDGVAALFGTLGRIEARVEIRRLFHEDAPRVDLLVRIDPGDAYYVGRVLVRGNTLTQDRVVLRQVRGLSPGRRFDGAGLEQTRRRLSGSALFGETNITVLGDPGDVYRDVLIEVAEQNTGNIRFGAGVSSDAGVLGSFSLSQRNFDLLDPPNSVEELVSGRAFRGAGQFFSLNIEPGFERSLYAISFREPYLFDRDYFADARFSFFQRGREDYDEQRLGGQLGFGRRFGDMWSISIRGGAELVEVSEIDASAPVDVFAVAGDTLISTFGLSLTRSSVDSRLLPTRGSRTTWAVDRAGLFGGDFHFTRLSMSHVRYWKVDEDVFGRPTVISLRSEIGYLVESGEAPIFERFYAGGHRSFRGFAFRGVGPRGIRNDTMVLGNDPVGGDWLFLVSLQYEFPLFKDVIRGVVFTDTGTVQSDFGFGDYRVSVGSGVRIKVPFLGQAPFAVDFAVPLVKEDGDETQLISFDFSLPF